MGDGENGGEMGHSLKAHTVHVSPDPSLITPSRMCLAASAAAVTPALGSSQCQMQSLQQHWTFCLLAQNLGRLQEQNRRFHSKLHPRAQLH